MVALAFLALLLLAATPAQGAAERTKPEVATLSIANREIAVFRAELLGYLPESRAERAHKRFEQLDEPMMRLPVVALPVTLGELHGFSILIGDTRIFSLLEADLDPEDKTTLALTAEKSRAALAGAIAAKLEQRRLPVLLEGAAYSAAATLIVAALIWVLHLLGRKVIGWLERKRAALAASEKSVRWEEYVAGLVIRLMQLGRWALVLSLVYGWLAFDLAQFPLTQPLGDRLAEFVQGLLQWLAGGALASVPGLVTVVVVLFVTRAVVDLLGEFFRRVQAGQTQVPFMHPDTVSATRRLTTVVVWTLGLVVAYPFIPGSDSLAFKGLSVLFGLVISLGSSGLVTQLMSGLVVIYSRALRKGDYVTVHGIEGVVSEIGALATKIVTMRNEEVTIPNSLLVGNAIHNYSKLGGARGTMLSTKVTIGYDAPWRQVHALLVAAAGRTAGLRRDPAPFVYQRGLQDFYVEYELFTYVDRPIERAPILSLLHGHIQDAFNEAGVQIMSPHFFSQPEHAVLVPPERWHVPPGEAPPPPAR